MRPFSSPEQIALRLSPASRHTAVLFVFATLIAASVCALPLRAQDAAPAPAGQTAQPSALAQQMPAALPQVLDSRITGTEDRARLVVDLSAPAEFGVIFLADPYRIMVTIAAEGGQRPLADLTPDTHLVRGYGVAPAGEGRVAVVMTLNLPAQVQQSYTLEAFEDQPARLVIDLVPDDPAAFAERIEPVAADAPIEEAAAGDLDGTQFAPGETSLPSVVRPLIVLDPGHGGADGGAESSTGLQEKNIVLAFALKLQQLLVATGRFDVALTRDADVFLTLDERVALARANQADLFISLHADSFDQEDVRGASVYTRGNEAENLLGRILADEEDATALVAGFNPPDDSPHVTNLLVDLLARETRRQSYIAGQALIEQLEPSIQLRRFPLRQADYFVLQAPEIPSVLIELGFLSNSTDTANLTTDAWLDRVAAALARGVATYFDATSAPAP